MSERNDFAEELSGDSMRITGSGRDPIAWVGIGVAIIGNLIGLAWIAGKFDQRQTTAERDIAELKAKASKDAEQDVQIAVISAQLATIQTGVGEIKAKLERP